MLTWVGVEASLCGFALCFRKRLGFLLYQICVAIAFLIALTMVQELDYTMSVYYAFALIPYIRYFKMSGTPQLLLAVYLCCATATSLVMNGVFPVVSSLIIHFIGPLVLPFVFGNVPKEELFGSLRVLAKPERLIKVALIVAAAGETVVGLMAMAQSSDGRLMLNYQCVSGCLSCTTLILAAILLEKRSSVLFSYATIIYMAGWTIASGTRGYIVLAAVVGLVVTMRNRNRHALLILALLAAMTLCIALAIYWDEIVDLVLNGMRFGESTGRRTHENMWFLNLFADLGIIRDLFGVGIGTTYSTLPGAEAAWLGIGESAYTHQVVMNANFLHNFWYMSLLSIGCVGTALFLAVFVRFAQSARRTVPKRCYALLQVFLLAYAFVLWFRWTATGGLLESAILMALISFYPHQDTDGEASMHEKRIGH